MIIPYYLIIGVGIVLTVLYGVLYFRLHPGNDAPNIRFGYLTACLLTCGTIFVAGIPIKTLVVVENNPTNSLNPNHRKVFFYGTPVISCSTGKIVTREYNLQQGKKYVLNRISVNLRYFSVTYSKESLLANPESQQIKEQHPITVNIPPNCCVSIPKVPEYWFCSPPDRIDLNSGIWERVWNSVFGVRNEKWFLTL